MTSTKRILLTCLLATMLAGCSDEAEPAAEETTRETEPAVDEPTPVETSFVSITTMAFTDEGTLLLGDSGTGKVHALTPPAATNPQAQAAYNLRNIDTKIAELLGTTTANVRVRDLAIHPTTKEAYLAVSRVSGDEYASAIVVLNQGGDARLLDPTETGETLSIPRAPADGFAFYGDFPSRDLTFTDLEVHEGKLYIAGLSNADFTSTLWTSSLPFEGEPDTATVEIFHAVHNQQETRAPIRTMTIVDIGGTDYLIAAYTCTPLVAIPVQEIQDGARITGKTIAELGFGNTPGDLLAFNGQDAQQNAFPVLFLQNKNQSAQVIAMQAIEAAVAGDGLTEPVGFDRVDLNASSMPMVSVLQVDEQDPQHLATIRRDPEQGDLELVSFLKNVYFRLSDFQSEYEIPGYQYAEAQAQIRGFQNMMKRDEGYASFVSE